MARTPRKIDTEALSDESLILLDDTIRKGQITLETGKIFQLDPETIINTAKWAVQTLKVKKPRFIADTSELGIKATRRTADGGKDS